MDKFLLWAATLFLPQLLLAQTLVRSGDATIRYDLIRPVNELKKITVFDSAGKVLSSFVSQDIISIDTAHGVLIRTQSNVLPDGRLLKDSTVADLKTLAPVRMRMVTFPHFMSMALSFQADKVHAMVDRGGKKRDTVHSMALGYFDSNLIEYILGLLPYKKGFHATLNAYTFERDGMDPYEVEYVGEDWLENAAGGRVTCYVVKTGTGGRPMDALAWVEKSTGKVLKRVVPIGRNYYVITKV
ncbi:MAG: hypothetical protein QM731_13665 [Chitinophagaceae bacterium]